MEVCDSFVKQRFEENNFKSLAQYNFDEQL